MQVKILNWEHDLNTYNFMDAVRVWVSPEQQYVIIEMVYAEMFLAGELLEVTDQGYVVSYISTKYCDYQKADFRKYSIDWSDTSYGFCHLVTWEMQSGETFKERIYLDPALYRQE